MSNQNISLEQAIAMTQLYRENKESILKEGVDPDVLALSETFEKEAIEQILVVEGCAGVRIYYGMSEDLYLHAILVAVDSNGADILPSENNATVNNAVMTDPPIKEEGKRCPPDCPPHSALTN